MILYFTGTGNSKYAADLLSDKLKDEVVSLNDVLKNDLSCEFESEKPFIVVAPIYAWRFPRVVEELIKKAEFIGCREIYFIGTMGENSGNAYKYCKNISHEKNLIFKGFTGIVMPNNYISYSVMPDEKEVEEVISKADIILNEIARKIVNKEMIEKSDKTFLPGLLSGAVNKLFTNMVSSKNFVVSDKCISCGKCEKLCSLNNIELIDGKPVFKDNCIHCYACIQHCPTEAINIKGKTENHGRYVCPSYDERHN